MLLAHKNRQGDIYYFKLSPSAKGKPRYYATLKKEGNLIDQMPAGYEIYEHPRDAMVMLRKKLTTKVDKAEIEIIKQAINQQAKNKSVLLDVKEDSVIVYLGNYAPSGHKEIYDSFFSNHLEERLQMRQSYTNVMRFDLIDEVARKFAVQCWCFRGSIDDWIPLSSATDLKSLAEKYCYHLGRDSFYNLLYLDF